jgi:AcrR family transcriptional regulator
MNEQTETHERVKAAALELARERGGLINVYAHELCERAGVPSGSFTHLMGQSFAEFVGELRGEVGIELHPKGHVTKRRTSPAVRHDHILGVALEMAREGHYLRVKRDDIAERAGVAAGSVSRYFGTMKQLQRAMMRAAVTHGVVEVVAQGILEHDPQALKAPEALRARARDHMIQLCQEGA